MVVAESFKLGRRLKIFCENFLETSILNRLRFFSIQTRGSISTNHSRIHININKKSLINTLLKYYSTILMFLYTFCKLCVDKICVKSLKFLIKKLSFWINSIFFMLLRKTCTKLDVNNYENMKKNIFFRHRRLFVDDDHEFPEWY